MSERTPPSTHPLFRADGSAPRALPIAPDDPAALAPASTFDRAVRLAAALLRVPMASIAVAGGVGLHARSCLGFPGDGGPRPGTPFGCPLSQHVFATETPLAVADVPSHPLGRGHAGLAALRVAAFLGVPIRTPDGHTIGMLSAFAHEPREFTDAEQALLADVAQAVAVEVELRAAARAASAADDEGRAMLRETEARYRLLFEANPRPTWVYDVDTFRFLAVNRAAVEAYGWSREEFLAMTILDIRPRDDVDRVVRRVSEMASVPDGASEWRHLTRDGRVLDVHVLSHPVPFGSRRARLVLVDDITERRRLETQLRDAQKMEAVGRLAGGIAHDFNNLLTAIKGYSQLGLVTLDALAEDPGAAGAPSPAGGDDEDAQPPLDQLRTDLGAIRSAADRAAALTAQLLAFSRRQVLQPVVLDLNAVAAGMEGMVRRLIGEHIDVRLELGARPGHVKADPSQLEQVLLNLVLNARDAMPAGGHLTVATADVVVGAGAAARRAGLPPGAYVALSVRDTGVGMDEATRSRMFEPFFTTKDVGHGTGLGLATVYGIVKQSGGEVRVESAPGKGTTVRVHLPATDEPLPAPRETGATPLRDSVPRQGATVLVVEDETSVRELACAVLRQTGYRVLSAPSAADALRLLERLDGALDLLVTDVVMPGASGPELAADVKRRHPGVAVIYMSGYSERAVDQRRARADGAAFVEKPFTLEEFRSRVAAVMGRG
ncbi:MAG: ATP-binding protein [Gemmatimonadaceae bacterium]